MRKSLSVDMIWKLPRMRLCSWTAVMTVITCTCSIPVMAGSGDHWTKIQKNNGFKGWEKELHRIVQKDADQAENTFCVVVDQKESDLKAYVYWPQKSRLIIWGPSNDEISNLDQAGEPLDLKHDVVATQDDIGSSTYLVTRTWVSNILSACRRYGTTLTIDKS